MEAAIRELVELSRYAGEHPRLVQGGGGNCSVKASGKMLIKASGYFLKEVSKRTGYAVIDLKTGLPAGTECRKPSIEINFHRLLSDYVIHTHPLAVGILVCAKQGARTFRKLFTEPSCRWIGYASPGKNLSKRFQSALRERTVRPDQPQVFFMANHGLVVTAGSKESCINTHEQVVQKLESFFGKITPQKAAPPAGRYLTPDHAVFANVPAKSSSSRQIATVRDMTVFIRYALGGIAKQKWDPAWLSDDAVRFVLEMSGEKYRQNLLEGSL